MSRNFDSFEIKIVEYNGEEDRMAIVLLIDQNGHELEQIKLKFVTANMAMEQLEKTGSIVYENCYIEELNLLNYRQIQGIAPDELILLNQFSLKNCFLHNEQNDLNLSHIGVMGEPADFSHSIFYAPSFTLEGAKVHSGSVNFEYSLFRAKTVNFQELELKNTSISFKNAIFKECKVNFQRTHFFGRATIFTSAEFTDGQVDFSDCEFQSSEIMFDVLRFGNGKKNFSNVNFGDGTVVFDKSEFCSGDVLFRNVQFGNGAISFSRVDFGDGGVDFVGSEFGIGEVTFTGTDFGNGKANFKHVIFGNGLTDFHFARFGEGDIVFDRARFGNGGVDFRAVEFGKGRISLNRVSFGAGDIIFEASKLDEGSVELKRCDFGSGKINFDSLEFDKASLSFDDVDFGQGLVTFRRARIEKLTLKSCHINNFFDLRLAYCGKLDLSGTIIKDVIDLHPHDYRPEIQSLEMAGIRLLGRIYIDWHQVNLKELIYKQETSYRTKADQFRLLKENFNVIGHYDEEDLAYVEFKRTFAKAQLLEKTAEKPKKKIIYKIQHFFQWLVFDFMGHYATNPIRVLKSTLYVFLIFSFLYYILPFFTSSDIHSSLFPPDDPRQLGPIAKALYHSVITFFTIGYGDYYPAGYMRILSGLEGFIGMFMMSYFTVAFVRKMLR